MNARAVVRVVTSRQKEEKEKDKDAKNANLVSAGGERRALFFQNHSSYVCSRPRIVV